jgi:pilus assembly protein Flp/PilA
VLAILKSALAHELRASSQRRREDTIMKNTLKNFLADETGATAIEYGLIAAGIALAIIAVVNGPGSKLNSKFGSISASLK